VGRGQPVHWVAILPRQIAKRIFVGAVADRAKPSCPYKKRLQRRAPCALRLLERLPVDAPARQKGLISSAGIRLARRSVRRRASGRCSGSARLREWLLLTSSLAWHDALTGNAEGFERSRAWVRAQARQNGDLPEQVTTFAQEPEMIDPWQSRWGPVATPLLWSHAMYLIMEALAPQ